MQVRRVKESEEGVSRCFASSVEADVEEDVERYAEEDAPMLSSRAKDDTGRYAEVYRYQTKFKCRPTINCRVDHKRSATQAEDVQWTIRPSAAEEESVQWTINQALHKKKGVQ
jgi:hypothetical protein